MTPSLERILPARQADSPTPIEDSIDKRRQPFIGAHNERFPSR